MPTILGRLTGVSVQTELLVMTFLGLVNSVLSWSSFDWTILVDKIRNITLKSEYFGNVVKTVLCWVVIARIIVAHLYTVTYLANFYSILTWCRPNVLLPWMLVSGFKNFLLEFIVIMVCLLLYMEREFSSTWLAAFMVCKVAYLVPAIYYWRTVNSFFVELGGIQRRKLTRAILVSTANGNASRSLEIGERLRFRSTIAGGFAYRQQRFTSLVNLDDFLFNSSFDIDGERDGYKMSKSLATLTSIDSQEFEDSEEDSRLRIVEDTSLTPVEISMRILGLNRDDINETRLRLGKNVLPTASKVEEIEEIVSTVEPKENVEAIGDRSAANATMGTESSAESSQRSTNVPPTNRADPRRTSKGPAGNFRSGCTCRKANEESTDEATVESRRIGKRSLSDDSSEGKSSEYEGNDAETSKNNYFPRTDRLSSRKRLKSESTVITANEKLSSVDIPEADLREEDANVIGESKESETMIPPPRVSERRLAHRSFVVSGFEKKEDGWVESSLEYPEDPRRTNAELFRADDVRMEQAERTDDNSETIDSDLDVPRSDDVQAERSLFRIDDDTPGVYAQTDFFHDAARWRSQQNLAEEERLPGTARTSTSTQTNISDCWKKTILQRTLDVPIDRHQDFFRAKPSDRPSLSKAIPFAGMTKFSGPKKRLETVEESEARGMKALRVYNRQTLFKYKREMEAKKQSSAFGDRAGLRSLIFTTKPTKPVAKDMRGVSSAQRELRASNELVHVRLDHIPKRQARSRPRQGTSKLSAFNLGLDALEYSISLSFSNENKNRTRRDARSDSMEISPSFHRDGKRQLSKYSKPVRIPEDLNVSSLPTTRFEGLRTGRDLDRTPGAENITGRSTIGETNRRIDSRLIKPSQSRLPNVLSRTILPSLDNLENNASGVAESDDGPELDDKHGIARLKETIRNIDWGFDDHDDSKRNGALRQDHFIPDSENVLYDTIDDTDVVSLLQSAFASNPENTERGFYLGPGSTELYAVSNYLDDVVEEIVKTARLRPNPDAFTNEPTTEVDYGESYLQEFQATRLTALEGIDEETDFDSESSDDIKIEDITPVEPAEFDGSEPIEVCWSSYSGEGFGAQRDRQRAIQEIDVAREKSEAEEYRQSLSSNDPNASKGIADLLGEKEISSLEFWTKELKDLASHDRRTDSEFTKQFRHLTELPGYCVVKTLVDFFRDFVAVSRSTMTSRMFLSADPVSTPSSLRSEEIISRGFNERSSVSLVNDGSVDPRGTTFVEVIDDDVSDSLRTLIDLLTGNTEGNDPGSGVVVGIHDDRTMFPLREDQFYFGTAENTRRTVKESLSRDSTSKSEAQDREFVRNEEIQAFHLTNHQSPPANVSTSIPEVRSIIDTSLEVRSDGAISSVIDEGVLRSDLTVDSYDSFYSTGAARDSKHSDNVVSIGGESPFEDFPESPLNSSSSVESQPRYAAETPHSDNR